MLRKLASPAVSEKKEEGLSGLTDAEIATEYKSNDTALVSIVRQVEADTDQLQNYDTYKQRMIALNESARERMRLQNTMLWYLFYTLLAAATVAFVHFNFPFLLGDSTYFFLEVLIFLIGGMMVLLRYGDYARRSPTNFHEIQLPDPKKAGENPNELTQALGKGDLMAANQLSTCIGQECCSTGTTYDSTQGKCIPDTTV